MAKVRLEITKGDEIRYISHLDYSRTVERVLRRANVPVAYSEGFNPHMKVAYASALAVGVASCAEYVDIELTEEIPLDDFLARVTPQLPAGIRINRARYINPKTPALMATVNLAAYEIRAPLPPAAAEAVKVSLARFHDAPVAPYVKESPKGRREVDVKQYLAGPVRAVMANGALWLEMAIKITKTGSVKPGEVLECLVRQFGLPIEPMAAVIDRTGLYISDGAVRLTPLDV